MANISKMFSKEELKKRYNFEDRKAFPFCYCAIALPFLFFCVFWVYVNIDSILQAFQVAGKFSLDNFKDVFYELTHETRTHDMGTLLQVEWRSIQLYLIGWLFAFPGYLSCYVLFKKCWGHYAFRTIFMIPTVLGGLTTVMLYKNMVRVEGDSLGPILSLATSLFDIDNVVIEAGGLLWHKDTSWLTLLAFRFVPHIIGFNLVQTGAYARIPGELFEVGRIDGLGFIREFWTIATPLTWSTMTIGFITGAAGMLMGDCGVFLYTQGYYNTATMGFYVYWQTYLLSRPGATLVYGYPAALGLCLTAVSVPLALGVRKLAGLVDDVQY